MENKSAIASTASPPEPDLKCAAWDDRMPVLLQPCGAVQGTAPFYGPITDARFANLLYSDWG